MRYRFREGMFYFKLPVLVELQLIIDSIYQNSRVDKTLWDSDFKDNKIDKWVYFAGLSLIHMNDAFQLIYDGFDRGSLDFTQLLHDIQQKFFPSKDTRTGAQKAGAWIGSIVGSIFSFVPLAVPERLASEAVKGIAGGISSSCGSLASTGLGQLAQDKDINILMNQQLKLADLEVQVQNSTDLTKKILLQWSQTVFGGADDRPGNNILTYLQGGRFLFPWDITKDFIATFYFRRILAYLINSVWKENGGTYILCANSSTPDQNRNSSDPLQGGFPESLYVEEDRRCLLYRYGILAPSIVESSVGAYEVAKFDYNANVSSQRLQNGFTSSYDDQPVIKGVAWEGEHGSNILFILTSHHNRLSCFRTKGWDPE
ncbi:MAG: hypothetical protein M1813_005206 [Trichoglossum hirsutum]|nr:MAG: hypothetical protein M1813_005206 [Trichoglossum hirsutum]